MTTDLIIEGLRYLPTWGDESEVNYNLIDLMKLQLEIAPKQVLGTIHSHPGYEPHISKQDIISAEHEKVFGIFSYWASQGGSRRRTSLDWYYGARRLDGV